MTEKPENKKLIDEELDEVTGGVISDMLDAMKKRTKRNAAQGQELMGVYHCLSCAYVFNWKVDSIPVCKCGERYNLKRISDLID